MNAKLETDQVVAVMFAGQKYQAKITDLTQHRVTYKLRREAKGRFGKVESAGRATFRKAMKAAA